LGALDEVLAEALEWERPDFEESVEAVRRGYEDLKAGRTRLAEEVHQALRRKHDFPGWVHQRSGSGFMRHSRLADFAVCGINRTALIREEKVIASLAQAPQRCPFAPENRSFPFEVRHLLYGRRPHV
jgi:hypothetical protein